ncbi:hypothetical protein ACWEPL_17880 [Nonomuraea sp. NPDC004186]|uniref:hypothetical protein n=1 Tax=Nonomuraea sp. NPDC049625 TaxID=3155775 RepID=UPI00342DCC04
MTAQHHEDEEACATDPACRPAAPTAARLAAGATRHLFDCPSTDGMGTVAFYLE